MLRLPGGRSRVAAIVLLYSAVAVAVTWPTARHPWTAMLSPFGDPLLNTWILAWGADRALHAFHGYWTGLFFYPYPDTVAYSEHLLGIVPFTAPLQWITGNPVFVHNVALVASSAGAGLGAWLLARELLGRDGGAVVAGLAYACAPFRLAHLTHLQVLASLWMPVALWALHRYLRRSSRLALAAFVVAFLLNGLSNGYYLYFSAIPVAIVLADGVWRRRREWIRLSLELGTAGAAVLAGLAPVAAAYLRVRYEQGLSRTAADLLMFSPALEHYVRPSPASMVWGWMADRASELALFPGLTIVLLSVVAIAGVVRGRSEAPDDRGRAVTLYAIVLLAAVLLSLGPRPTAFGHVLPFPGPYGWLAAIVPGLNGLRVVARLGMVVALALAVLAGFGVERLTRARSRRARLVLLTVCGAAIVAEGLPVIRAATVIPTPDMRARLEACEWLRSQPPGPMLALPIGDTAQQTRYVYETLVHRNRIVNGYSGYGSALQGFVGVPFSDARRLDEAVAVAGGLGVRWLVIQPSRYGRNRAVGEAVAAALRAGAGQVARLQRFGEVTVAELRPMAPPAVVVDPEWRERRAAEFDPTASQHRDSLALAFDRDRGTRWSSGDRQRGDEWVALDFRAPVNVARVRIDLDRSTYASYPRGCVISGSEDGVRFSTLFDGFVADRLALSIVREPRAPGIDIVLPSNRTRVLRLAVTGSADREWAIPELRVWTR